MLLWWVAAAAVVYSTGYRHYENLRKALHDGIFDMGFDMAAGGLFGGTMQYWQAKQWNEAAEQHKQDLRSRS